MLLKHLFSGRPCRGREHMKHMSSNLAHDEVYSIQNYVIKLVRNLPQVGDFCWVLRFPQPIKLTATI